MNKISVVIPYHGREELLEETLTSLSQQIENDFEVVLTDDSEEGLNRMLLDKYINTLNIKYIRTIPNLGPIPNTMQGIKNATNDYIHILHSDDLISPSCIKLETTLINKYPSNIFITHLNTNFTNEFNYNEHDEYKIVTPQEEWLSERIFTWTTVPSAWCFHKSLLNQVILSDKEFSFVYDWNFLFEVLLYHYRHNKTFIEIPRGYVGWREHSDSESAKKALICYSEWETLLQKICSTPEIKNLLSKYKLQKMKNTSEKIRKKRLFQDCKKGNIKIDLPRFLFIQYKLYFIIKKILSFFYHKTKKECKTTYTILGIKITKKTTKKIKKDYRVDLHKVPLIVDNEFLNIKNYVLNSNDYLLSSEKADIDIIGVVIQGPILKENDFTLETCKIYKKIFNNNEKLILSTWNNEDLQYLKQFEELGVDVILSEPPLFAGRANLNYQIVSTLNGIKKAKDLGCKYVIKTRTDQRFYKTNISRDLLNLITLFPLAQHYDLNSRLIALSFNSFKYRYYGISDMFIFGHIDDVMNYWNIPLDETPYKTYENIPRKILFKKYCSETYIASNFLHNIDIKPNFTLTQTWNLYKDLFIFIDRGFLDLYWPKYTSKESRWNFFYHNMLEEINFNEWLNLYMSNKDIIVEENVNYVMPKIEEE